MPAAAGSHPCIETNHGTRVIRHDVAALSDKRTFPSLDDVSDVDEGGSRNSRHVSLPVVATSASFRVLRFLEEAKDQGQSRQGEARPCNVGKKVRKPAWGVRREKTQSESIWTWHYTKKRVWRVFVR